MIGYAKEESFNTGDRTRGNDHGGSGDLGLQQKNSKYRGEYEVAPLT